MMLITIKYIIEMISVFYMIFSVDVATQMNSFQLLSVCYMNWFLLIFATMQLVFFFLFQFSNMVIIYSLDFALRYNKICHIPSIAYISLTLMNKGKSLAIQWHLGDLLISMILSRCNCNPSKWWWWVKGDCEPT